MMYRLPPHKIPGPRKGFTIARKSSEKDKRPTVSLRGGGNQIMVVCPDCKGIVRTKKAKDYDSGPNNGRVTGIKIGDLLIGSHRFGGGAYSARRGDSLCKGVGLPAILNSKEE